MKTRDIGLLFLLALCLSWGGINLGHSFLSPSTGLDFTQYYIASRMALEGEVHNIYRTDRYYFEKAADYGAVVGAGTTTATNAYPPFAAFCLIPFVLLPSHWQWSCQPSIAISLHLVTTHANRD